MLVGSLLALGALKEVARRVNDQPVMAHARSASARDALSVGLVLKEVLLRLGAWVVGGATRGARY